MHDKRGRDRLADFLHRILEHLAVLRLLDGESRRADQLHLRMLVKISLIRQLHREIQSGLTAQSRKQGIRFFLLDDFFHDLGGQRLDIDLIGDILVRHNRRRVAVQQHDLHAFLMKGTAGLRSGVVKLRRLTDDDRAGTDHHDFPDVLVLRHASLLSSSS